MSPPRADGAHDRLTEHDAYEDPWPLLVARCRLLDSLDLLLDVLVLTDRRRAELTPAMREALHWHGVRAGLVLDALVSVLAAPAGEGS